MQIGRTVHLNLMSKTSEIQHIISSIRLTPEIYVHVNDRLWTEVLISVRAVRYP